jgi:drug/metabolite transporter (DMT)-like permease
MDPATVGALCALGSALSWAVTSLLVRSLTPPFGTLTINAVRTTLCAALILAWALLAGGLGRLTTVSAESLVLLGVSIVLAIAIGDTLFFESTRTLGLGRAMTVSMSYPVVAALLAAALLGERITVPIAVGGLLTLGGLVLVVAVRAGEPPLPGAWRGVGGALLAALAWGISVVALRPPLAEMDPVTAQAVRLPVGAALLWALPWAQRGAPALARAGRAVALRLLVLSVVTAASSVMYVASVKHAGVAIATVLSSTAPLFAVPLGIVFLGERLPAAALVGAVIAVAGIVVLRL